MHGYVIAVNSNSVELIRNTKQAQFAFWRQIHMQQQRSYHAVAKHSPLQSVTGAAAAPLGNGAGGSEQAHGTQGSMPQKGAGFEARPQRCTGGRFKSGELKAGALLHYSSTVSPSGAVCL